MEVPIEMTFRHVPKTKELEDLINSKAAALEKLCDNIISCRVAIEKPQEHQRSGNPYRVRIDLRVPPGHEIVVKREPGDGNMHDPLDFVIRESFDIARRKLKALLDKQHHDIKTHPEQEVSAVIDRIFMREQYGFLKTTDGREVYFHANSVINEDFDNLEPGMGVRFVERLDEAGLQASTVQIVDRPRAK